MDFESLIGARAETQANFSAFQGGGYLFKLEGSKDEQMSHIVWVRRHASLEDMFDYAKSGPMQKACIMPKFVGPYYETLCAGFHRSHRVKIWVNDAKDSLGPPVDYHVNRENLPQPDWDMVRKALGEIAGVVSSSRNNISVQVKKIV